MDQAKKNELTERVKAIKSDTTESYAELNKIIEEGLADDELEMSHYKRGIALMETGNNTDPTEANIATISHFSKKLAAVERHYNQGVQMQEVAARVKEILNS